MDRFRASLGLYWIPLPAVMYMCICTIIHTVPNELHPELSLSMLISMTTRSGILITLLYNICMTNFRLIYKLALVMYFSNFVTYCVLKCWW